MLSHFSAARSCDRAAPSWFVAAVRTDRPVDHRKLLAALNNSYCTEPHLRERIYLVCSFTCGGYVRLCFDWHYQYQPVGGSWLIFHCRRDLMFAVTEEKIMELCPKAGKILFFFPCSTHLHHHPFYTNMLLLHQFPLWSCGESFSSTCESYELVPYHRWSRVPCLEKKIWQIGQMMLSDSVQMLNGGVCGRKSCRKTGCQIDV